MKLLFKTKRATFSYQNTSFHSSPHFADILTHRASCTLHTPLCTLSFSRAWFALGLSFNVKVPSFLFAHFTALCLVHTCPPKSAIVLNIISTPLPNLKSLASCTRPGSIYPTAHLTSIWRSNKYLKFHISGFNSCYFLQGVLLSQCSLSSRFTLGAKVKLFLLFHTVHLIQNEILSTEM